MIHSVINLFAIIISYPTFLYIFLFVFGLFFGSFFKVIVDRSKEKYTEESKVNNQKKSKKTSSWVTGRSCCQSCGEQIYWYDNIPLLSYLLLGGKCRFCKNEIGLSYPLIEFLTGIIFIFVGYLSYYSPDFFQNLILNSVYLSSVVIFLWLILLFDVKYMIIPDELVVLISVVGIVRVFAQFVSARTSFFLFDLAVATLLLLSFLLLRYLPLLILKKYGLGWGDIKLVFPLAMVLGYKLAIVGIFCAFIIGGIWGIILLITRRAKVGQMVSFGPLLALGSYVALAWGDTLWQVYWQLL